MAGHDGFTRYTIRLPDELYQQIQSAAEDSNRSVNGEIAARLEESFSPPNTISDMDTFIARLAKEVEDLNVRIGNLEFFDENLSRSSEEE